jgi:putative protease
METYDLKVGEKILITGDTTGAYEAVVDELRFDLKPVDEVVKGQLFSIKTTELVRRGDKLYKLVPQKNENFS